MLKKSKYNPFITRLIICVLALTIIGLNSVTNFAVTAEDPTGIEDQIIEHTYQYYKFLKSRHNKLARKLLMVITFALLDLALIWLASVWIKKAKNWRPVLTLILFYTAREICCTLFTLKSHEDLLWKSTGIPSLTVSYIKSGPSFYSGIIGLYFICGIELYDYGYKIVSVLSFIGLLFYFILIISLRAQYFLCLFSGLVAAHYFHIISSKYCHLLDLIYKLNKTDELVYAPPSDFELPKIKPCCV